MGSNSIYNKSYTLSLIPIFIDKAQKAEHCTDLVSGRVGIRHRTSHWSPGVGILSRFWGSKPSWMLTWLSELLEAKGRVSDPVPEPSLLLLSAPGRDYELALPSCCCTWLMISLGLWLSSQGYFFSVRSETDLLKVSTLFPLWETSKINDLQLTL